MGAIKNEADDILTIERSLPVAVLPEGETPGGSLFLCSMDCWALAVVPTLYTFHGGDANVAGVIKQALSRVLVHYYPLAGRLAKNSLGKLTVDCERMLGVPFVEASADCNIGSLGDIKMLDAAILEKLVYRDPAEKILEAAPLLTAQVTRFKCGGFTLGVVVNHCMTDGISAIDFMNSWSEAARGKPLSFVPRHNRTFLKARVPPQLGNCYNDFVRVGDISNMTALCEREQIVFKTFPIDGKKLAALRKMATAGGQVMSKYSTFVVLSALVWRARTMALKMKPHQLSQLLIYVDFRSKMKMPDGYFGNAVVLPCCLCTAGELIDEPISSTAERIKKAIEKVDEDFVLSAIDYMDKHPFEPYRMSSLLISSWMGLEFGDFDFGWGGPTQLGTGNLLPTDCVFMREESENRKDVAVALGLPLSAVNAFQELVQI
ncbi:hypothetical protein BT93_H0691 [Corymbia citriodora subsp. variegata]|nr:hypothetical protein BT93_H0691 [Corymbia citriodora subsp. variegata]KAF8014971.1 hypothetical protein BT93_H0691 [Corymbia citriodora subsp. variegata]